MTAHAHIANIIDREINALFTSGGRELHSSGSHECIAVPAHGGHDRSQGLHQAVEAAFERARRAGQANPILVGAIPFDVREASCLYVPAAYEWREPSGQLLDDAPGIPDLLDQRTVPDEAGFKRAVRHAIVNFHHSDVRKAVLSVIHELRFAESMDVGRLLARLHAQNSQGYLFRIPLPDGGELVGVSPELLLRKQGGRIVSNPLAGSAKRQRDPGADRAAAERLERSEKDQYEHRLVIENIRKILEPHCAALDVPERPSLMSTAAMWHLSTLVEGVLKDPATTALQLACLIHPTPAVCGFPTESAHKLIRYVEPFERGLFTGLVGWCDSQGNGEWAITIRCGIVKHDTLRLFAGAGIVEASNPASEWEEVQAKLGTMLNACGLAA